MKYYLSEALFYLDKAKDRRIDMYNRKKCLIEAKRLLRLEIVHVDLMKYCNNNS